MGIHDRDYYRESARGMFDNWAKPRASVWLIAVTCGAFFAQCLDGPPYLSELVEWGARDAQKILDGEVWRLVSSAFLHVSLWHLFFNMLVLYWAGSHFEELYSSKELVAFYLGAAAFTSGLFVVVQLVAPAPVPVGRGIGASMSIMAVLVVFAFHYPHQQVLLFGILPLPVWLLVVLYIGFDLAGALGAVKMNIGHLAHLGGALFGFLYYQSGRRLTAVFRRSPARLKDRRRPSPALRLVPVEPPPDEEPVAAAVDAPPRAADPSDEPFEAKVDRVLAKVSAHGKESLTAEERDILFRAGEVYKNRRK